MTKPLVCRYCGESFMAKPGKPGFNDECPRQPKLTPEAQERTKQFNRAVRAFRKHMTQAGYSQEKIDRIIRLYLD